MSAREQALDKIARELAETVRAGKCDSYLGSEWEFALTFDETVAAIRAALDAARAVE